MGCYFLISTFASPLESSTLVLVFPSFVVTLTPFVATFIEVLSFALAVTVVVVVVVLLEVSVCVAGTGVSSFFLQDTIASSDRIPKNNDAFFLFYVY
jgi:hypothetical protein